MKTVKSWWEQTNAAKGAQPVQDVAIPAASGVPAEAGPIAAEPKKVESELRAEIERLSAEMKELRLAFDEMVKQRKEKAADETATAEPLQMGSDPPNTAVLQEADTNRPNAEASQAASASLPAGS